MLLGGAVNGRCAKALMLLRSAPCRTVSTIEEGCAVVKFTEGRDRPAVDSGYEAEMIVQG